MVQISQTTGDDSLPCRSGFSTSSLKAAKRILNDLPQTSPELLEQSDISPDEWVPLLRAAVESMRGTSSATGTDKRRFIDAVLRYCAQRGLIDSWGFIGSSGRQDYRVTLPDGTDVAIEAKGCPDGNNTNIWDRPSWADEFIVWSLCPESLAHNPGHGVWSGVAIRLLPKVAAERKVVDAFVYWDARCGTKLRRCSKDFGVYGDLRKQATDIDSQAGKSQWVPPPCIYLFPKNAPTVPHNLKPAVHTIQSSRFARMLLEAFNVPQDAMKDYVHTAEVEAKGTAQGTEIQITTISRCWSDGNERVHTSSWKPVKREA
jgi:hypothetical protein